MLSGHERFHRVLLERGYEPVGTTVLLEADLSVQEPRDPRTALIRRLTQVEFLDDALPTDWWQNVALGEFPAHVGSPALEGRRHGGRPCPGLGHELVRP